MTTYSFKEPFLHKEAACRDMPLEWFFNPDDYEEGLATCRICPVEQECLEHHLRTADDEAVAGGMAPRERMEYRRRLSRSRAS